MVTCKDIMQASIRAEQCFNFAGTSILNFGNCRFRLATDDGVRGVVACNYRLGSYCIFEVRLSNPKELSNGLET